MIEIISQRTRTLHTEYHLNFQTGVHTGSGYSFPCDEAGKVNEGSLHPEGLANLRLCQNGDVAGQVQKYEWYIVEDAKAKCHCGKVIALEGNDMGECGCECGRVYNTSGQELVGFTRPWTGQNEFGEYYSEEDY